MIGVGLNRGTGITACAEHLQKNSVDLLNGDLADGIILAAHLVEKSPDKTAAIANSIRRQAALAMHVLGEGNNEPRTRPCGESLLLQATQMLEPVGGLATKDLR
jgi:hypothetical protein